MIISISHSISGTSIRIKTSPHPSSAFNHFHFLNNTFSFKCKSHTATDTIANPSYSVHYFAHISSFTIRCIHLCTHQMKTKAKFPVRAITTRPGCSQPPPIIIAIVCQPANHHNNIFFTYSLQNARKVQVGR